LTAQALPDQKAPMLRILGRKTSSNVQKVLWCLVELGQPFEREDYGGPFGRNREPDYLRLNPNGTVPTLVDGELVLWESNSILRYLANKFGPTLLYPVDDGPRALIERWMDWQLGAISEAFGPLYRGLVREKRGASELEESRQRTALQLAILDSSLAGRDFLGGANLTLADMALGPIVYRWFELPIHREETPHLRQWYERIALREGFRTHLMIGLH
jgi:glutathione S-transferase